MRIALLGRGRVGRTMATLLPDARTWGRGEPMPDADVYWILVRDADVGNVPIPAGRIGLHASGALGPDVLPSEERGVLHPLMTFPGPEIAVPSLAGVPARVDGTPGAVAAATTLARSLGMVPFSLPGDPRAYHAAACLASGHLAAAFLDAADTLAAAGVTDAAAVLLPLAVESLRRAAADGDVAITGPIVRGDTATIAGHLAVLEPGPRETYEALARRIRSRGG